MIPYLFRSITNTYLLDLILRKVIIINNRLSSNVAYDKSSRYSTDEEADQGLNESKYSNVYDICMYVYDYNGILHA